VASMAILGQTGTAASLTASGSRGVLSIMYGVGTLMCVVMLLYRAFKLGESKARVPALFNCWRACAAISYQATCFCSCNSGLLSGDCFCSCCWQQLASRLLPGSSYSCCIRCQYENTFFLVSALESLQLAGVLALLLVLLLLKRIIRANTNNYKYGRSFIGPVLLHAAAATTSQMFETSGAKAIERVELRRHPNDPGAHPNTLRHAMVCNYYYWPRRLVASAAWVVNDFAFYGNKLQQVCHARKSSQMILV
jgi:hypothetical protein